MTIDPRDGGWKSRKLWSFVFTSVLIVSTGIYGSYSEGFKEIYSELVMGLVGSQSVFFGANSFSKWSAARASKVQVPSE